MEVVKDVFGQFSTRRQASGNDEPADSDTEDLGSPSRPRGASALSRSALLAASKRKHTGERSEVFDTIANIFGQYAHGQSAGRRGADSDDEDTYRKQSEPVLPPGPTPEQVQAMRDMQKEVTTLRAEVDRLRASQSSHAAKLAQSVQALEANAVMVDTLRADAERAKQEAERVREEGRAHVQELQRSLEALQHEKDDMFHRALAAEQAALQASTQASMGIGDAQSRAATAQGQLQVEAAQKRQLINNIASLQQALAAQQQATADVTSQLEACRHDMASLAVEAGKVSALTTHVTHLLHDNSRLLALLRSTQEYKTFAKRAAPLVGAGSLQDLDAPFHRSVYVGGTPEPGTESYSRFLGGQYPPDHHPRAIPQSMDADYTQQDGLPAEARWDELARLEAEYGATALAVNEAEAEGVQQADDRRVLPLAADAQTGQATYIHPSVVPYSTNVYTGDVLDDYAGVSERAGRPGLKEGAAVDSLLEVQHWIPADAASLASRFRRKYLQKVPPEAVAAFLLGMNVVWLRRMDEVLFESTSKLRQQIKELKQTLQRKQPYREVMQASTITRLYSEITALRQALGKTGGRPVWNANPVDRSPSPVAFGTTIAERDARGRSLAASFRKPGRALSRSPSPPPASHDELQAAFNLVTGRLSSGPGGAANGGTLGDGALAASMLSIPGSGAKRHDGVQSAALLTSALEAVDVLTGQLERAETSVHRLKDVLRSQGLTEAEIVALLQPASGGQDAADAKLVTGRGRSSSRRPRSPPPRYPVTPRQAGAAAPGTGRRARAERTQDSQASYGDASGTVAVQAYAYPLQAPIVPVPPLTPLGARSVAYPPHGQLSAHAYASTPTSHFPAQGPIRATVPFGSAADNVTQTVESGRPGAEAGAGAIAPGYGGWSQYTRTGPITPSRAALPPHYAQATLLSPIPAEPPTVPGLLASPSRYVSNMPGNPGTSGGLDGQRSAPTTPRADSGARQGRRLSVSDAIKAALGQPVVVGGGL